MSQQRLPAIGVLALMKALGITEKRVTAITVVAKIHQFTKVIVEYHPDVAALEGLGTLRKEYELRPIEAAPEAIAVDGEILDDGTTVELPFSDGQFGRMLNAKSTVDPVVADDYDRFRGESWLDRAKRDPVF